MHEQAPIPDEDRSEPEVGATAALVAIARLMGRQAALEHFAASCSREDEHGEEAAG